MPPLSLMIKPVSGNCNMRCRYCFYADVAKNRAISTYGVMTEKMLETLVRRALSYADDSCSFAFQGGEPTLAGLTFFQKLIAYESRYNTRNLILHNSIQTNGYDMTDEMAAFLAEHHFLVGVSLDGVKETHDKMRVSASGAGTYDRVLSCLKKLKKAGVEFNVLCVVTRYVAQHPKETFEALSPYGYIQYIPCIDDFGAGPLDHSLTSRTYAQFLIKTFDLYHRAFSAGRFVSVRAFDNYIDILMGQPPENCAMCGRCSVYYLVESDGSVYPCDFYVLDQFRMGNLQTQSFFTLEKSPIAQAFRQASFAISDQCSHCKWFILCRGGCRRDREPIESERLSLNKWCESYRALFDYAYPQMLDMAKKLMT
ncbi:MAG: anaerobic sulfatase maturase, partial [Clostridia bacterium]